VKVNFIRLQRTLEPRIGASLAGFVVRGLADGLLALLVIFVQGTSLMPALWLGSFLYAKRPCVSTVAFAVPLCYFVYLCCFVVVNALGRRVIAAPLKPGRFRFESDEIQNWQTVAAFAFANHVFFLANINIFHLLRYTHYRLLGARIAFSAYPGLDFLLVEPDLVSIGQRSATGLQALLICHMVTFPRRFIRLGRISIGDDSQVGAGSLVGYGAEIGDETSLHAGCVIAPCVCIGNQVSVGAGTIIGSRAVIHDGAKIGPKCQIRPRSVIEEGATLLHNSVLLQEARIPKGETWEGDPARLVGSEAT